MCKIRNAIDSGHLKFFRESNDFITVSRREAVRWDNNAAIWLLSEANQRRLDFTRSFHAHFYRIDPCRRSSAIQGAHITSPARVVSAHQNADLCQMRCDLLEELDPLSRDPEIEKMGEASEVCFGSGRIYDKAALRNVRNVNKNDWERLGFLLQCDHAHWRIYNDYVRR